MTKARWERVSVTAKNDVFFVGDMICNLSGQCLTITAASRRRVFLHDVDEDSTLTVLRKEFKNKTYRLI